MNEFSKTSDVVVMPARHANGDTSNVNATYYTFMRLRTASNTKRSRVIIMVVIIMLRTEDGQKRCEVQYLGLAALGCVQMYGQRDLQLPTLSCVHRPAVVAAYVRKITISFERYHYH